MRDTVKDEQFTDVFDLFRAEVRGEIIPPGTDVVRRSVRRRRTVRSAATTVLTIVGLVGIGLIGTRLPGSPPPPVPGESVAPASLGPTLSPAQLDRLGADALEMLGYRATDESARLDLLPTRPGIVFGGLTSASEAFSYGLGNPDEPLPAGDYYVHAGCSGSGHVSLAWTAPGATASTVLTCGEVYTQPFTLTVPGVVGLAVHPDAAAADRAGFAFALTDPRIIQARGRLAPDPPTQVVASADLLSAPRRDSDESEHPRGTYRLTMVCVGAGTLEVTFTVGKSSAAKPLACTNDGALTTLTVTTSVATTNATVSITPNDAALDNAAYAYRVTSD